MATSIDTTHPGAALGTTTDLRERTLALLGRLSSAGPRSSSEVDTIVELQSAANHLGAAQSALERPAPASLAAPRDGEHALSAEAAAVFGLAEVTLPYADSRAHAAAMWLRVLRREGAVGSALTELGFPYGQLIGRAEPRKDRRPLHSVTTVRNRASELCGKRGASHVNSLDILFAVFATYGGLADRVLYSHGISREQLLAALPEVQATPAAD